MIEIKVTRDGRKITIDGEMDIDGTRKDAISEFVHAMHALKKIDKDVFHDALRVMVCERMDEMIAELEEREDEDEDEGGKHDD